MQVHLDMTDKTPFFIRPFYSERRYENKNRQRNGQTSQIGNIKERFIRIF